MFTNWPAVSKLTLLIVAVFSGQLFGQEIKMSGKIADQVSSMQDVIAEGIGATPDEAIKNAFRAAVQQVVGAVVDAEMIVKDDAIIEDRVLSYSDGFVKTYSEIKGSKSEIGGLCRIKIRATVERRSVMAKLKAANVFTREIDGAGLYSEVVSQLQAADDAATIIEKQFEGFPESCIKISIVGKPQTIEKSDTDATIKFTVMVEPDLHAYKAFQTRLIPVLQKIALAKGDSTVKFQPIPGKSSLQTMGSTSPFPAFAPNSFSFEKADRGYSWKKDFFAILVATSRTKNGDRVEYRYFEVDPSVRDVLCKVIAKRATAKLHLLDENAEVIATERFEPQEKSPYYSSIQASQTNLVALYGPYYVDIGETQFVASHVSRLNGTQDLSGLAISGLAIVGPTFDGARRIEGSFETKSYQITQDSSTVIELSIKLSLDEIRSLKGAKVEISFDEGDLK